MLVVCFCAAWCDTCDGVRAALERIAAHDEKGTYIWLDIEDDAALVDEIEIENFPTLAVYRDGKPLFFGVSPPQEGVIARTLGALARLLELSPNATTELVDRAVTAGLVTRTGDGEDARVKQIAPTPHGTSCFFAAVEELRPERRRLLSILEEVAAHSARLSG